MCPTSCSISLIRSSQDVAYTSFQTINWHTLPLGLLAIWRLRLYAIDLGIELVLDLSGWWFDRPVYGTAWPSLLISFLWSQSPRPAYPWTARRWSMFLRLWWFAWVGELGMNLYMRTMFRRVGWSLFVEGVDRLLWLCPIRFAMLYTLSLACSTVCDIVWVVDSE